MGRAKLETLSARFESKVDRTGPCHEWTASLDGAGYGQINVEGKPEKAHRVAWFLTYGVWPVLPVLHTCDNPPCVNPQHLYMGTKKKNAEDMVSRGRHANQLKTHCPQNHEYTPENTRLEGPEKKFRRCKKCKADEQRKRLQRRRNGNA